MSSLSSNPADTPLLNAEWIPFIPQKCEFCGGKGQTDLNILFLRTKNKSKILHYVTNSSELLYRVHHENARERVGKCWMCDGRGIINANKNEEVDLPDEDTKLIYDDTIATLDELNEQIAQAEKEEAAKKEEYEAAKRFTIEIKIKHQKLTEIINETLLLETSEV